MNRPLIFLWTLLIVAVGALFLLARMWNEQHDSSAQSRARRLLATQLTAPIRQVAGVLDKYETQLSESLSGAELSSLNDCVKLTRLPVVQALIVVDPDNNLVYPTQVDNRSEDQAALIAEALELLREFDDPRPQPTTAQSELSSSEVPPQPGDAVGPVAGGETSPQSELLDELQVRSYGRGVRSRNASPFPSPSMAEDSTLREGNGSSTGGAGDVRNAVGTDEAAQQISAASQQISAANQQISAANQGADQTLQPSSKSSESEGDFSPQQGWVTWYHRRGMMLGYLTGTPGNHRALAILPRARWLADIVGALPSSGAEVSPDDAFAGCLWQVTDVEGKVVYQWTAAGQADPAFYDDEHEANQTLSAPLEGWRMKVFATPTLWQALVGRQDSRFVWMAVSGLAVALFACGVLLSMSLTQQLRQAKRRVSFVNQVSHELRTPLTNIRMYADLLQRETESESGNEKLSVIRNEARRLGRLIDNVLVFAKAGRSKLQIKVTETDVHAVIREVVDTFRPRLSDAGIEAELDLEVPGPQFIDAEILEQILVNLIANAEKYAASGKRVIVSARMRGGMLEIVVRDFGPGVSARFAEKVFQPFVRSSDRIDAPAGTGIGLSIVRDLARLHGGECRISRESPGAEFIVHLDVTREGAGD